MLGLDEVLEKIGENNSIKAVATPYRERAFEEIKEACSVEVVVGLFGQGGKARAIEIQEAGNR